MIHTFSMDITTNNLLSQANGLSEMPMFQLLPMIKMEIHKNCTEEEELMMDTQPTERYWRLKLYSNRTFLIQVIIALHRMYYDNRRRRIEWNWRCRILG
jgi:hypothetical protein